MSGPPPPLGNPWMQDIGSNPNITRDGPPPLELNAAPAATPYGIPYPYPPPMMMWPPPPGPPMMPVMAAPPPPPPPTLAAAPPPPYHPGWGPWGGLPVLGGLWGAPATPVLAPVAAPTPDSKEHWIYPHGRDPGISYMYPDELCTLKRFLGDAKPWEMTMQRLDFNILQADTNWTIATLISRLRNGETTEDWAVSELVELGNGKWEKRSTLPAAGDKGRQTLKEVGWTGRCNDRDLPAVWIYVHKQ